MIDFSYAFRQSLQSLGKAKKEASETQGIELHSAVDLINAIATEGYKKATLIVKEDLRKIHGDRKPEQPKEENNDEIPF